MRKVWPNTNSGCWRPGRELCSALPKTSVTPLGPSSALNNPVLTKKSAFPTSGSRKERQGRKGPEERDQKATPPGGKGPNPHRPCPFPVFLCGLSVRHSDPAPRASRKTGKGTQRRSNARPGKKDGRQSRPSRSGNIRGLPLRPSRPWREAFRSTPPAYESRLEAF